MANRGEETPEPSSDEEPKPKRKNHNRIQGDKNEKLAAAVTGLKPTAGSGCGLIEKGDLGSGSPIHLEAKSTRLDRISIPVAWIDKAVRQMQDYDKKAWILQVAFMERHVPDTQCPHLRWVVLSCQLWYDLGGDAVMRDIPGNRRAMVWSQHDEYIEPPIGMWLLNHHLVWVPETWLSKAKIKEIEDHFED